MRPVLALLVLALAVTAGAGTAASKEATTASSAPPAGQGTGPHAGIGIRLLPVPGSTPGGLRARLYIIGHLAPGSVIRREFQVVNLGNQPVHLLVYPAAATIAHGSMQFAAGRIQNQMTTWVRISQHAVSLAPHGAATLTATIAVPRDAPGGEQYGVIWAEQDRRGPGNILLASRVGIRLYLSVGSGRAPVTAFILGVPAVSSMPGGAPVIRLPVRNTGGLALDIRGTLQLADGPGGVQAGPFRAASVLTLAPGQSFPDRFVLSPRLPRGPWRATFTMVSGPVTRTETATLTFPAAPALVGHPGSPAIPVAAGAGAAILLAAAALLIIRSRRAAHRAPK
jgi:hypothetical protein